MNGGIRSVDEVRSHLGEFDGVMLGREAYSNPYLLAQLHRACIDERWIPDRDEIIVRYATYVQARLAEGHRLQSLVRHIHGLYSGLPRVRSWRRFLSERAASGNAGADVLIEALRIVQAA